MNKTGLPEKRFLDSVSFRTQAFNSSLKKLHLSEINLSDVMHDLAAYKEKIDSNSEIDRYAPYRVKTWQSVMMKYDKYVTYGGSFTTCFNDLLGFRITMHEYPTLSRIPEYFRVVDLRHGKKKDDGYRAIHLYYSRDNLHYPIEIQIWSSEDYGFNELAHIYLYKYKRDEIGAAMRKMYSSGIIRSKEDFVSELGRLTGGRYDRGIQQSL